MAGYYRIVEAQYPILKFIGGHDLTAVLNPAGQVIEEFDGLATSANGQTKAIGYLPSDTLKVYDNPGPVMYSSSENQATLVASTDYAALTPYINAMKTCAADINALNLPYPFLGFGANSNSVDSTLDACMGVPEPNIKGNVLIKPGVGTMLLSPAVINNVAVSNGLGQPPSTTGDSYVSGSSNSGSSAAVVIENPDGTTTNFEMGTSGSNGVGTETSNDTAANQVWTQTNTIAPDGTTTVASSGHGNTLAIDGATISEAGQRPSDPANSLTDMGNNDVINVGAVSVGKLGSPDGGTVIFGAGTSGEVVNATGGGGVKVDEGNGADAVINGGENGGWNEITLGTGDEVLDNGWDQVSGGSSNVIDVGANDVTDVTESGVTIAGKGGDTIEVTGTDDHIYADSSTIDINGADTGDIVYGSGDSGDTSDWGGYVNEGGGYGGYGGGGYYYSAVARRQRSSHSALASAARGGVDIGSLVGNDAATEGAAGFYTRVLAGAASAATESASTQAPQSGLSSVYLGAQQLIHAMSRWPVEGALQSNNMETGSSLEQQSLLAPSPLLRLKDSAERRVGNSFV